MGTFAALFVCSDGRVEALLHRPGGHGHDHRRVPPRHRPQGDQQLVPSQVSTVGGSGDQEVWPCSGALCDITSGQFPRTFPASLPSVTLCLSFCQQIWQPAGQAARLLHPGAPPPGVWKVPPGRRGEKRRNNVNITEASASNLLRLLPPPVAEHLPEPPQAAGGPRDPPHGHRHHCH